MRAHWSRLTLVYDEAGVSHDEEERRRLLSELRDTGAMREAYLIRTWAKHESPTDRKTDWDGFDTNTPRPLLPGDES